MKRISPERKATTLAKLLPPYNMTVATDRGWQYCSADYQALLKRYNLHGSISAKGCCYDNACAESVFHSLKVECIHGECFISREQFENQNLT